MAVTFDHTIVRVKDLDTSVEFWVRYLGLSDEGREGPFAMLRVNEDTMIQLAPWGTEGNEHFAFSLDPPEFDAAFELLKQDGIAYGDTYLDVGNMKGPGTELGARGAGRTLYFFDPNHHLLEIRSYA